MNVEKSGVKNVDVDPIMFLHTFTERHKCFSQ